MIVEKSIAGIRSQLKQYARKSVALVPTMGNLHRGHLQLVEAAKKAADVVVVTIFVNPLQFSPGEDLAKYPRTLEQDIEQLTRAGVDLLFCPSEKEMYPFGRDAHTQVVVPELSQILCGIDRPGHFEGVATVVVKLLNIVQPDVAFFGEKDFQQLQIIKECVRDLSIPVDIKSVKTVREESGLALSSRNAYLTDEQKLAAPQLHQQLQAIVSQVQQGSRDYQALTQSAKQKLQQAGFKVEYLEVRRQKDLAEPVASDDELIVLVAARLGKSRLIDNEKIVTS